MEEEEEEEPVLIEVGINGGDGGGFDVRRSGEAFGQVDGVASQGEKRLYLRSPFVFSFRQGARKTSFHLEPI